MKKVININFQGTVVPIEESAYELLREYIDSLRTYFAQEEGRDEIINDIESRISELFQERLKNGATCITDDDVNAIIDNMGRPKDFAEAESNEGNGGTGDNSSNASASQFNWQYNSKRLYRNESNKILGGVCSGIADYLGIDPWIVRILFILSGVGLVAYLILWIFLPGSATLNLSGPSKRLYRNPDDKIIAGVCGGIGSYFNINPWIPRVIFLLPFVTFLLRWQHFAFWTFPNFIKFTFSPGTFLVYVILWIVIPEARTTSEKLQMKGEKVDLDSIKESVTKEMKEVAERMKKFGQDSEKFIKEKGSQFRQEAHQPINNAGGMIGRIIVTLIKVFVYIILGAIAFSILAVVFAIAVAAIGIFPLKTFIVTDGWQNVLAWLTLIFFIGVPVIGTITFIIRLITRRKSTNNYYRNIGIGLWIFGWICFFALISFVGRDFKYISSVKEQKIELNNPQVNYLEIVPVRKQDFRWKPWLSFEPYSIFDIGDDTALVPNIHLKIYKSPDSNFQVSYFTMSNGNSKEQADRLASKIKYNGYQQDSIFYLDNEIPINSKDKFRNQFVEVSLFVPVNHRFKIDDDFLSWSRPRFYIFKRSDGYRYDRSGQYDGYDYDKGVEYIMKEDGPHEVNDWDSSSSGESSGKKYRYFSPSQIDSLKNTQEEQIRKMERTIDSVKESHKEEIQRVQDSLIKQRDEINKKLKNLDHRISATVLQVNHTAPISAMHAFFSYI